MRGRPRKGRKQKVPYGALAFYHVHKNHRSFQSFWGKKIRPEYEMRYYLLPMMKNPEIGRQSDSVILGGRVTGKSWAMELAMAHSMFNTPFGSMAQYREREVVLTGARDLHISQRCEPLFDFFQSRVPLWKSQVVILRRKPYELRLKNGSLFWGISVGNDPTAKNLEGPHPWKRFIEETAHFPKYAWTKWQDTAHERGTVDTYIGVCDGRIDTPYYSMDHNQYPRYAGLTYHIPQIFNPQWNQEKKDQRVYDLKGEDSDAYQQQVMAEWGTPSEGIWNLADLQDCVEELPYEERIWTPKHIRKESEGGARENIRALVKTLPSPLLEDHDCYVLDFDPGYVQDGEILVLGRRRGSVTPEAPSGVWDLYIRVILRNRVVHQDATLVFHLVAERYGAILLGIDATGEQGKDIANTMMDRENLIYRRGNYTEILYLYEGQKTVVTGHQKQRDEATGIEEEVEVKQKIKDFTTTQLAGWFTSRFLRIPRACVGFIPAFNAETVKQTTVGNKVIQTPQNIHLPDAMRVFYAMWHYRYGRIDAPSDMGKIVMPVWINNPKLRRIRPAAAKG